MNFRLQHPIFDTPEQIILIPITQEYLSFFDSPHHHVMQSSFYIESRSSWLRAQYHYLKCMSNIGINGSTAPYSRMEGYKREYLFPRTRLPWAPPSPNMTTPATALYIPVRSCWRGPISQKAGALPSPLNASAPPISIPACSGNNWRKECSPAAALRKSPLPRNLISGRENYAAASRYRSQTAGPISPTIRLLLLSRRL